MNDKAAYPSDQADKVLVRMPDGMRDRLKEAAKINNRTMNAEIVARLEQAESSNEPNKVQNSDGMLLRMLASFVLLQRNHPEVMAPMEETITSMCQTITEADKDADILAGSMEAFVSYVNFLTEKVEKTTELLGAGWAKDLDKKSKEENRTAADIAIKKPRDH